LGEVNEEEEEVNEGGSIGSNEVCIVFAEMGTPRSHGNGVVLYQTANGRDAPGTRYVGPPTEDPWNQISIQQRNQVSELLKKVRSLNFKPGDRLWKMLTSYGLGTFHNPSVPGRGESSHGYVLGESTIADFGRFGLHQWLNDVNINSVLRSLAYAQRPEIMAIPGPAHRVLRVREAGSTIIHFVATFFFTLLTSGPTTDTSRPSVNEYIQDIGKFNLYNYEKVKKMMRSPIARSIRGANLDPFLDVGFVFMPVNLTLNHWLCIVVDTGKYDKMKKLVRPGHIYIYDFLGGGESNLYQYFIAIVRRWIKDEMERVELDPDSHLWGETRIVKPWQVDSYTCGDRVLVVAWLITLRGRVPTVDELSGIMHAEKGMERIRIWLATIMFNDSLWLPQTLGYEQLG
jgi:hypothetical protein